MVQMFQLNPKERKKSFGESFGMSLLSGIGEHLKKKNESKMQQEALKAQEQSKMDLLDKEYGLKGDLEEKKQTQKLAGESEIETRDYNVVKEQLGEKFAKLWRSQPIGARTKLIETALESKQRGINLEEMLGGFQDEEKTIEENIPKSIDFDKGLTPKERSKRQESRYSSNLPLYQKSQEKLMAYETAQDDLDILKDLSPKISAIERFNINPISGDLLIPAAASPEAQRYIKTINEFTRTAKDTYGSRVTNFDLTQFLKRLPTLANSEEGRRQILEQMDIINKINMAHEKSLQDVIDEHGGIRNIDFDKAESIAKKRSNSEIKKLRSEFTKISNAQEKSYENEIKKLKEITPKGRVAVQFADGRQAHIEKDQVDKFLKTPGNKVL